MREPLCRRVVVHLQRNDGSASLEDLADALADRGLVRKERSEPRSIRDVMVRLHHVHLPRLEAAGLLDYDPDRRSIVLLADRDDIDAVASVVDELRTGFHA